MSLHKPRILSGWTSVLLDTLRLGAALVVVFRHGEMMWFPARGDNPAAPGNAAHAAVVIFFVLSGYVIAHTTTSNNRGPLHYAQARLSRLYSVMFPALLLTAFAELAVAYLDPVLSAEFTRGLSWPRYLVTSVFLNEIWFHSAAPPVNGPLWSLSFEFWYYAIFGLWFYRRPSFKGLLLPLAACMIAGPRILLMMPLWIFGVIAYRMPRPQIEDGKAWLLVGACLLAAAIMVCCLPPYPYGVGLFPFFFAGQFITDWAIGAFVAAALWLLPSTQSSNASAAWIGRFRQVADLTFPIYLLHKPLLILWQGIFKQRVNDSLQLAEALVTVLLVSAVIGVVLEKQRPAWVKFFKWLLNRLHHVVRPAVSNHKQNPIL